MSDKVLMGSSKVPYTAKVIISQESHIQTVENSSGYTTKIDVEGGVLLNVTIAANTLEELKNKVASYVKIV